MGNGLDRACMMYRAIRVSGLTAQTRGQETVEECAQMSHGSLGTNGSTQCNCVYNILSLCIL